MPGTHVAVVDSGGANIASLFNALRRLGVTSTLTRDPQTISDASHVILPGVGAAADAMRKLEHSGLASVLTNLSQPVLGICLGMQLLARASAEHNAQCLGIVPAEVVRLNVSPQTPVPNMGWCRILQTRAHELFAGIENGSYFYFVHGYALPCNEFTIATANHSEPFTAVLAYRNFFATQFHPERSAKAGARLLLNFINMNL